MKKRNKRKKKLVIFDLQPFINNSLELQWSHRRVLYGLQNTSISKHYITTEHSCDCTVDAWQPVHPYDRLPSTLQSCDHYLQSSLSAAPENQWGSCQGRLQAPTACCRAEIPSQRAALWEHRGCLACMEGITAPHRFPPTHPTLATLWGQKSCLLRQSESSSRLQKWSWDTRDLSSIPAACQRNFAPCQEGRGTLSKSCRNRAQILKNLFEGMSLHASEQRSFRGIAFHKIP